MGAMPDANTFYERQHDARESRREKRHERYGSRAEQDMVDELMMGRQVGKFTIHDFTDQIDNDDLAALMMVSGNEIAAKVYDIREKVEQNILLFLQNHGSDLVDERVQSMEEDARAEAAEARAER